MWSGHGPVRSWSHNILHIFDFLSTLRCTPTTQSISRQPARKQMEESEARSQGKRQAKGEPMEHFQLIKCQTSDGGEVQLTHGNRRPGKTIFGIRGVAETPCLWITQKDSFLRLFQKRHLELFLQRTFWFIRVRGFPNVRRSVSVSSQRPEQFPDD